MATERYATGHVYFNGGLLFEEVTVDLGLDLGNIIQKTQARGFAGVSPGAGVWTVKVTNAVPRLGLEYDFYKIAVEREVVELIVHRAAKKLISKGFVMNISEKHGVDTASTMEFDFTGEIPEEVA